MSRHLRCSLFVMFVCFICVGICSAGVDAFLTSPWKGTWQDKSAAQSIISITQQDGFIDVRGKDVASIYSCTGIIEKNMVECFGSGVNHEAQLRFLYQSQLRISDDQQTIEERWEASFAGGKKFNGKAIFQRKMPRENR